MERGRRGVREGGSPWGRLSLLFGVLAVAGLTSGASGPPPGPAADSENVWIEWSSDEGAGAWTIGGYGIALTAVDDDGLSAPRLTVKAPDTPSFGVTGEATGWDTTGAEFAVVQLRANDPARQVLFSSFSGGAHCCTSLILLEFGNGGWRRTDIGRFDGDRTRLPTDIDGDGVKEFVSVDQRFLYAFTSYAGSWAPPVIREAVDGEVRDLSADARFRSEFARYLPDARKACADGWNGACAAYVAAAARLGRLDAAWAFMLRSHDRDDAWDYPAACRVAAAPCPDEARQVFATFPEALQWYLGELGYTGPSYVEPLNAHGPGFDCRAARRAAERLICADDTLARLDRRLAVAYARAMALSPDRNALRAGQRGFLAARDGMADAGAMAALYAARIEQLSAVQ